MPRLLLYLPKPEACAALLRERLPDLEFAVAEDEAALRRALPETQILAAYRFPLDVLNTATRLRWMQITSSGVEFLLPAREQIARIVVTSGRGIHAQPIADYVMAGMTMLLSDFPGLFRDQAARRWTRRPVVALAGRTLGIVGLGPIGREIARRAAGAGMAVLGVRASGAPLPEVATMYAPDALESFLARCDAVVLALPETDTTRGMMGRAQFAAMKRSAILVNVGRGALVDEPALVAALAEGTIAGACLDVFAVEPLPQDSPLWSMPNVIVTPHIAGMRDDYTALFTDILVENLGRFDRGEPMLNVVDFARGY